MNWLRWTMKINYKGLGKITVNTMQNCRLQNVIAAPAISHPILGLCKFVTCLVTSG